MYCTSFSAFSSQINLGIYMQDKEKEFSVLVDRSVGGSSILDGQIELMLHRSVVIFFKKSVFVCLFLWVATMKKAETQ